MLDGVERDTIYYYWLHDKHYTHTDVNRKFIALPCPERYGFVGIGTIPTWRPYISHIYISAAGAEAIKYGYNEPSSIPINLIPNPIELKKINYNVVVTNETVSSGQNKKYYGRKSLTVSITNIHSGGKATFTSSKGVNLFPGFNAEAGSSVNISIVPPNCNELNLFLPNNSILDASDNEINKIVHFNAPKEIELSFEKDFYEHYISIYPNPANSMVTIQLNSNNEDATLSQIKLYDIFGRVIMSLSANGTSFLIDVSKSPKGIYFIEASGSETKYYQKLIIN